MIILEDYLSVINKNDLLNKQFSKTTHVTTQSKEVIDINKQLNILTDYILEYYLQKFN